MSSEVPEGPHEQLVGPVRVQLRRTKGWRMPPNTVRVARPGKWGNPFTVAEHGANGAVLNYQLRMHGLAAIGAVDLSELRGKNLACWCALDQPCHADVLLRMANAGPNGEFTGRPQAGEN